MIGAWYVPAWEGDFRLEPDPGAPDRRTLLTIKRPTAEERRQLRLLRDAFHKKEWVDSSGAARMQAPSILMRDRVVIRAPLSEVGPVVASLLKPGPNVLTAVKFKDGHIEVCETSRPVDSSSVSNGGPYRSTEIEGGKKSDAPKTASAAPSKAEPKTPASEPTDESKALAKKENAEAAVTVKRPTPCCPNCYVDEAEMNRPATEVLLAFLDERQHATWAKHRYIVVRGGITGHRYLLAHRNSPIAAKHTKICFDLDSNSILHFHDWLVPASEEVLAAMLILRFREPWLRNEATAFADSSEGHFIRRHVFKNPFGGGMDGVADSSWTYRVGSALLDVLGGGTPTHRRMLVPNAVSASPGAIAWTGGTNWSVIS